MGVLHFWLLFVFLGLFFNANVLNSQSISCNPTDLNALIDFSKGLDSPIWSNNSDCCNWFGITCDSTSGSIDGRVVKLELPSRKLSGKVSESLGNLDQLKTLNLSTNSLRGLIPASLLLLPNLVSFDLSSNGFSGEIPATIDLPSLQNFDISENFINGSVPSRICENSTRILNISLSVNYFAGVIPPGFGNCASLHQLCLGDNILFGDLPEDLFWLSRLIRLDLQENSFSGPLSSGFGNLTNLNRLDVSKNNFTGIIPDIFHGFSNLQYFLAQSNNFTASLPNSLLNSPTITTLNLRNNSLYGSINLNCSAMINLVSLDLGTNLFHGAVPDTLSDCNQLTAINLAKNNFKGPIPESFKNFRSLSYLSFSNCSLSNLSSSLSILQQIKNLSTVVLTLNFYNEELPSDSSLHFENLKVLIIASCRLTGSIPTWLRTSTHLQLVDLSWNRLTGNIPGWFGEFDYLFYLDLSNNSFTGEIPVNITNLESLIYRNISLEEPAPDFPFFMKQNTSTRGLQYNQVWSFKPTIDLSTNQLSGSIWPEFGKLKKLHVLELKENQFSGTIPSNLSGMTSLETLDLSHNNLTGSIPTSLVSLSFLSTFSVAHNNLSGRVPTGGQFGTFPNSSFEGNNGLCGEHASPCQSNSPRNISPTKTKRSKGTIIGMAVGIGLGTAFLLALMCLIFVRTYTKRGIDPEKVESDTEDPDLLEPGSKSVVFFRHKDDDKEISIDDLLKSTDSFDPSHIVGCGGFGLVYKATLPNGRSVAVKKLSGDCGQMDREFQAEVETLSRAQHPNLVLLQGYCRYKKDRLLIYSYMENSSLDYWLHEKLDGGSSLDWDTRLRIAQGAARGLAYLHQSCEPHILHRDIKSSNILLNKNFDAHLADFGLARLIRVDDTHVSTDLVGTLGYIPPEYGMASVATYKGDVYSFGVVLLELVTGKRPMDMCKPRGCRDLISWVREMRREKRENEVFDPFIYGKENLGELSQVLEIACLCLNESPKARPTTQELVTWLDKIDLNR